ncbi:dephospho-CoA kinase [Virgibacillus necropolis]|uniref:Dephospho-CoA kinase n=1 Tax=Virgibacillus necropolis TaxID=163877 RepID=A0A221MBM1_9BACI|nr:dephospho-CoA kinase [Virgibacillus necropolis]ASN05027.1 dephospho-CoA kinase [Virgibacillus necropolis]
MALIIGLTGSIASGKSTVSTMFHDYNIPVVDADKISRDVVCPGEEAYQQIVETFGEEILLEDKTVDRKKLGAIIFPDKEKRTELNEIVHPAVRKKMLKQKDDYIAGGANCVVLDIPLLFESKLTHFVDKTVVVYVNKETQLDRLMKRDNSLVADANSRINSQLSLEEKAELADVVIDNNGTKEKTREQLDDLLQVWKII